MDCGLTSESIDRTTGPYLRQEFGCCNSKRSVKILLFHIKQLTWIEHGLSILGKYMFHRLCAIKRRTVPMQTIQVGESRYPVSILMALRPNSRAKHASTTIQLEPVLPLRRFFRLCMKLDDGLHGYLHFLGGKLGCW